MAFLTNDVGAIVQALRNGGIAAFPTETVYGLGAAATGSGVEKIFSVKGRPRSHPLIVHVNDFAEFPKWARQVPPTAFALAERFLPGPITIVLKRGDNVPDAVTGGRETVALRVPSHPLARELLANFGKPVAAPSANIHGRPSATNSSHVLREFADADFPVLDGGSSPIGIESAIVDLSEPDAPRLLRSGSLPLAQIREAIGAEVDDLSSKAHALGPGGLARHYSPAKELVLVRQGGIADVSDLSPECGMISSARPSWHRGPWERAPASPAEYARSLYAMLRRLDAATCATIVVERPPSGEEWHGIHDRLARAAGEDKAGPRETEN